MPSGSVTLVKLQQHANEAIPILVTLFGISIFFKLQHPLNAPIPILVTLFGISILVKLLHPQNALSAI